LTITIPAGNIGMARFSCQQPGTNALLVVMYGMFDNLRSDDGLYAVHVQIVGSGLVTMSPPGLIPFGSFVALGAGPSAGWAFKGWSGDFTSTDPQVYPFVFADMNVTATFIPTPQTGPDFVVTTLDDHDDGDPGVADCTLREAINACNASPDNNTISFAAGLSGF